MRVLRFDIRAEDGKTERADITADWPSLDEMEGRYIRKVLRKTQGKLTGKEGAARVLGIHYTTLRARLKRLPPV